MKNNSKICAVIPGPSYENARQQIISAQNEADIIELRLDLFNTIDLGALAELRTDFCIPMVFTLRSKAQGGKYLGSESQRLEDIQKLAELHPEYVDLERDVPKPFVEALSAKYPDLNIIISHHEFSPSSINLDPIYQQMIELPATHYKIALQPSSTVDSLRLLTWAKEGRKKIIPIAMGEQGQSTRILGPLFGSPMTYACLNEKAPVAPGQIPVKTLKELYRFHGLNLNTHLFGLIGHPVDHSISHVLHNLVFKKYGMDAVYIKFPIKIEELGDFLSLARKLPFKGLSVTMPLKEVILPYLDQIDPKAKEIGAVNTLSFENGKILGFNTDSFGALNAIETAMPVKGKHVVIIGAGGAAKAIGFEAHHRGATVTFLNRHIERAQQIGKHFPCSGYGLEAIEQCYKNGYDILINTTPIDNPIQSTYLLPQAIYMDIKTKAKDTPFLQEAESKGCRIVYGYQMFIEQALGQFNIWFKDRINLQECREFMVQKFLVL